MAVAAPLSAADADARSRRHYVLGVNNPNGRRLTGPILDKCRTAARVMYIYIYIYRIPFFPLCVQRKRIVRVRDKHAHTALDTWPRHYCMRGNIFFFFRKISRNRAREKSLSLN